MAKFSATILAVAVIAVYVSVEVLAQTAPPKPLGSLCEYRSECDANACIAPSSICCDGYSVALASKVTAASKGKCTCCAKGCAAELAHGQSVTNNTASHADAYHQGCLK